MEIAICAIARLENLYIKEWVDYHLALGFSHIYIYDNNREGEECIINSIDSNAYSSVLTIIPFHNESFCPQIQAYNDCYNRFEFDWLAYIDLDEFFTFGKTSKYTNIQMFLRDVKADAILVNWVVFGDNGECYYNSNGVVSRFKHSLPLNFSADNLWGKQPINRIVKSIVRKEIKGFKMDTPHVGSGKYIAVDTNFQKVKCIAYQPQMVFDNLYLRHYITRSFEEFLSTKGKRPAADGSISYYPISSYFKYNKPSIRKCVMYFRYCKIHGINENLGIKFWVKLWIKMCVIIPLYPKYYKKL